MITEIEKAADLLGSGAALARRLGVTPQAIYQWDRVPAEHVLAIENATRGRVKRHELRPDLYPPPRRRSSRPIITAAE